VSASETYSPVIVSETWLHASMTGSND